MNVTADEGHLTDEETQRLESALVAAWAVPLIDDVEDFIWEAIFCYAKGRPVPDTLREGRCKLLCDVVDVRRRTGWSLKALQCANLDPGAGFEFVIQRADIFGKWRHLGLLEPPTREHTDPAILGKALIDHWNAKVEGDTRSQKVATGYIGILLKSNDRRQYVYIQERLLQFDPDDYSWQWARGTGKGLQARRRLDDRMVLKWYPSGAQLFQCMAIPADATRVNIEPQRLRERAFVRIMLRAIQRPRHRQ